MTVSEMIQNLQQFPKDQEVQIIDGLQYKFYKGDFKFQLFEDTDGSTFVYIGIGGYDYE